jgi:hypothetical protein
VLPVDVFCGRDLLLASLRRSNIDAREPAFATELASGLV